MWKLAIAQLSIVPRVTHSFCLHCGHKFEQSTHGGNQKIYCHKNCARDARHLRRTGKLPTYRMIKVPIDNAKVSGVPPQD